MWTRPNAGILTVAAVFLVLFPVALLSGSRAHRDTLTRKVRSTFARHRSLRHLAAHLPQLRDAGSEWRFDSADDSRFGGCADIPQHLSQRDVVGQGYSKRVYRFGHLAVKRVLEDGQAVKECMQLTGKRLLLAYCLPTDPTGQMSHVMELAQPLDTVVLARLTWKQRVKAALDVTNFLLRLWPLVPNDFRRQQFLRRANGDILFTDFDSVSPAESTEADRSLASKAYGNFVTGFLTIDRPETAVETLSRLHSRHSTHTLTLNDLQRDLQLLQSLH